MSKVKSNLIKLFSCLFAVCLGFAIVAMPNSGVEANDTAVFEIEKGASIRLADTTNTETDDDYSGLRFQTNVNQAWFDENSADKYTFGTLIFPTSKISYFSTSKSPSQNASDDYELQADNILADLDSIRANGCYTASIVFDEVVLKTEAQKRYEENGKEFNDTVWESLYPELMYDLSGADFTAVSYVLKDGKVTYLDPYSTSMAKVAVRTLIGLDNGTLTDDANNTLRNSAEKYVGTLTYETGYVSMEDNLLVIDSVDGYSANEDTYVTFSNTTIATELDENSQIKVSDDYSSSAGDYKTAYVFESDSVKVVNTFIADKMLKSASDVILAFDRETWAEDDARIDGTHNTVYALCGDVDMTGTMIENTKQKDFKGVFDGRGYSIWNATVEQSVNYSRGFFNNTRSATIRNVAFRNFNANGDAMNAGALSYQVDLSTYENIFVEYGENTAKRGLFRLAGSKNTFKNLMVSMLTSNYTDWTSTYGTSPFMSYINSAHEAVTFDNVYIISPKPLGYVRTSSSAVGGALHEEPVYDEATGYYTFVGERYTYAENETQLHYTYQVFRDRLGEGVEPNVENTKDIEFTYLDGTNETTVTKTIVKSGIRRYNDYSALASDNSDRHKENLGEMLSTGLWKVVDGQLLWYNDQVKVSVTGGDYDASANALTSTAFNDKKVNKVLVNGVELVRDTEYFVDENTGDLTGIYAKTSATDTTNGITYKVNSADNTIQDEIVIITDDYHYTFSGVNYWTRIIDGDASVSDASAELKLALDIDYTANASGTSENGIIYNTTDGYVFNAGIYKLGADIDMTGVQLNYTGLTPVYDEITGGFAGTFDGDGHYIENFKPTKHGLFGTLATEGSGLEIGATVKNVAFTKVLTTKASSSGYYLPVIASTIYEGETVGQHISDVYVDYSEDSTDMYGLIGTPTKLLYMSNVYVVNETGYDPIESDRLHQYYFADGTTLSSNKYYKNVYPSAYDTYNFAYTSSLFASVRFMSNVSETYINNVIVASPNLISYNWPKRYMFKSIYKVDYTGRKVGFYNVSYVDNYITLNRYYYGGYSACYLCNTCGYYYSSQSCTRGCESPTFTSVSKVSSSSAFKQFGYAGNEATGNLPLICDFAPQIKTDLNSAPYTDASGNLVNTFSTLNKQSKAGYFCDSCKKFASLIKGTTCSCGGTMNTETTTANSEGNAKDGIWSSPYAYQYQMPDLQSREKYATISEKSNCIVRFMGVTKYDTVEEVTSNCDFSSFTSKVWTIGEDGSLNWTSLYSAQA